MMLNIQRKTTITLTAENIQQALEQFVQAAGVDIEKEEVEFVLAEGAVESFAKSEDKPKRKPRARKAKKEEEEEPVIESDAAVEEVAVVNVEPEEKVEEVEVAPEPAEEAATSSLFGDVQTTTEDSSPLFG